jgi:hypothetical protein
MKKLQEKQNLEKNSQRKIRSNFLMLLKSPLFLPLNSSFNYNGKSLQKHFIIQIVDGQVKNISRNDNSNSLCLESVLIKV